MIVLLFALAGCACVDGQLMDLSGSWLLQGKVEGYAISRSNATAFAVLCDQGPCTAWKTATITVVSEQSRLVQVDFSSGLVHHGSVDPYDSSITWTEDGSVWLKSSTSPLVVHLVPHSHNDPGWKDTVTDLYNTSVQYIYTAVTQALSLNPERTFGAEIAVFWSMWWAQQNASTQAMVRGLVANGQLEFTGSGWVQNDEAIVRFEDTIDQMTLGHLWVQSAMGSPPVSTAWQADPFGHSNTQAYLYSGMAMDGYVFGRPMSQGNDPINAQSQAVWHPMRSFPDAGVFDDYAILTHAQTIGYWEPYRDMHPALASGSASEAATILVNYINQMAAKHPSTTNMIIMCGDDFQLADALVVYPTLDQTLAYINANTSGVNLGRNITVKYSTPKRFLAALAQEQQSRCVGGDGRSLRGGAAGSPQSSSTSTSVVFPPRPSWDMMPLIGCEFPAPWTGFYTSRPEFKNLFHAASAFRRSANTLHALARDPSRWEEDASRLLVLWEAVGLVQHHDAITADAFDNVMEEYKSYINNGLGNASAVLTAASATLGAPVVTGSPSIPCFNVTAQPCDPIVSALTAWQPVLITVYNPLSWTRDDVVELLIPSEGIQILDQSPNPDTSLMGQVSEAVDTDYPTTMYSLSFLAKGLPPLGFKTYLLTPMAPFAPGTAFISPTMNMDSAGFNLSNTYMNAVFNGTGAMQSVESLADATGPVSASASLLYYSTNGGVENAWDFSTGGLQYTSAQSFGGWANAVATTVTGPVYSQVNVIIDHVQRISIRMRLYAAENFMRIYSGAGPFLNPGNQSMDAILRLETGIANNGTWATDSNGLEMLPRVRNARPWWSGAYLDSNDPVSSNYYPITAGISMSDVDTGVTLSLLPSLVSHGGASMADGELEILVNRAVMNGQAQQQTGNRHTTVLDVLTLHGDAMTSTSAMRPLMTHLANPLMVLATPIPAGQQPPSNRIPPFAPLAADLPASLEVLTLQLLPPGMNVSSASMPSASSPSTAAGSEVPPGGLPAAGDDPLSSSVLLLRLRHIYTVGEDDQLAQPVTIDIAAMLAPRWSVIGVTETTLTATRTMAAAREQQIQWAQLPSADSAATSVHAGAAPLSRQQQSAASSSSGGEAGMGTVAYSYPVTLRPMDIRTFTVTLAQ